MLRVSVPVGAPNRLTSMGKPTFQAALLCAAICSSTSLFTGTSFAHPSATRSAGQTAALEDANHFGAVSQAMARGDRPAMAGHVVEGLRDASARWSAGETVDEAEAAVLEAELAFIHLTGPRSYVWKTALAGLDFRETAPSLNAAIAWLREDVHILAPLTDWEFVGPFDNERGRGMNRPTPVEKAPSEGPYAGKVRDVDWRIAPAPGRDGVLYLGELVEPSSQVCVVAHSWIQADAARRATLLIGATEELRVWWNGEPVYEALGLHDFGPDGHAIQVDLAQGWNQVTVKVGGQDAQPAFAARLVDHETGASLSLTTRATRPEGVEPMDLKDPGRRIRKGQGVPAPGAHAYLAQQGDTVSVIARSALGARACGTPRKERPGYQDAKAAYAAEPELLSSALIALQTIRVAGALDVEEDINPWLDVLNATIDRHGPKAQLMNWYAGFTEDSQGLVERALALVEQSLDAEPTSVMARLGQVHYLQMNGQAALAEQAARALGVDPAFQSWPGQALGLAGYLPWSDSIRAKLIQQAVDAGDPQAARIQRETSTLMAGRLEVAAFLTEVRSELEERPYDNDHRLWAARRLLTVGEHDGALTMIDEALALSPESGGLHSWRGRALLAAGDRAGAIDALDQACEYDPSKADEQRLLDFLISTAGADELALNSEAGEVPLHVRYSEPLVDIVARHPAAQDSSGGEAVDAPREVLLNRQVVEVGADGKARRYRRVVQRVLSEAGVRQLDRRSFRAYPGYEDLRVLHVRVLHTDGTIEEGQTGRGSRLTIDLPPLEIGDVVDMEWRRDDLKTSIFGNYFGLDAAFAPEPQLATREADITVLESPELKLYYHLTGNDLANASVDTVESTLEDGTLMRRWSISDLTPRRSEALEPPAIERTPRVQASTYADWETFGQWWWSLIREEIAVSPEMSAKVAELTNDKETRAEKLRAIYDFVVTDIRYNAWEFGVHGYQPYSAPVIFSRRFGDCKDKAILMRAMLSEVGIEAWPVLIQSDQRRHEEDHVLPLVAHFNHCIAYIPAQEGVEEMFLDGTARLHPLEVLPDSDRGARVLTVRSDGAEEMRIAFPEAAANESIETITIDLSNADAPVATYVQQPKGRWDPKLRYRFSTDDTQRAEAAEGTMTGRFGAIRGDVTAEHPDYEDLTTPLKLTLSAQLERVGRRTDEGWELPTCFAPYRLVSGLASESERTTDVLLDVPWAVERTIVYLVPEGVTLDSLLRTPEKVTIDTKDIGYTREVSLAVADFDVDVSASATKDPVIPLTSVIVKERLELRTHRVPLERYNEFREAARKVDAAQRQNVSIEVPQ
ncbi:MAG: tetratricopeptide (TPR) repeat protein/predicted transglutaminase-like cysteine proteinase [Planctomycetota bacterium]|jgi:tetratricopeptide (TPR) repeat protein/predicted transglutaminase-like cysteine proteinase